MTCTECTKRLNDYVDGDLDPREAQRLEAHVARCSECQAQLAALRTLLTSAQTLPREIEPSRDLWAQIQTRALAAEPVTVDRPQATRATFRAPVIRWFVPLAVAASILLLAAIAGRQLPTRHNGPAWSVATLSGAPRVDRRVVEKVTDFRLNQWLETDAISRAKVVVGSIGEVTVDPNSRLRLSGMGESDHRLDLKRGSLQAMIWAPPRLFFVDTPSATAVDLGCAYTLTVADNGDSELHVTMGYVALADRGRESIIPARAMCVTRKGVGPGTPFSEDASTELRTALSRFDFEPGAALKTLPEILRLARAGDAITLWHLLVRVPEPNRGGVYDRLASFHAPPPGVARAAVVKGDDAARRQWGDALGFGTWDAR